MLSIKKLLAGKVLLILLFAGALGYIDTVTDLKLGLDLKGGTQLDYSIDLTEVDEADRDQLVEGVKEVIRRRVDGMGVSEPNIYVSNIANEYHVIVELAGITDLEEAKATVGKTIQLEFREENPNPDNTEQLKWATDASNAFLEKVNGGEDFATLAESEQKSNAEEVTYQIVELIDVTVLGETLMAAVQGKEIGTVFGPFELDDGYTIDSTGAAVPNKGMAVIQVTDHQSTEETTEVEEKVSARHILIAYQGAERADATITRTKEEALILIEEVQAKLTAGGVFEDLAKEYTDDASGKENGGDLSQFGKGAMTQAFEDAAFALEVNSVSDVVETEFGYHLIQVYDHQEATTVSTPVESYAFNKIIYSTSASPWMETAAITGEQFKHADVAINQTNYQAYVNITFTEEGGVLFEELTGKNVGKRIAIFVGGNLISAPNVNEKISGGSAQITGDFTLEEAQDLARDLNTGAIPAPVELVGQYNISATLGQEALDQSLFGGLIGVIVLAIFMILYYRLPGLIAVAALAIYSALLIFVIKTAMPTAIALLLSLAIFGFVVHVILKNRDSGGEKLVAFLVACFVLFFMTMVFSTQITLTLAGIAGVILSIGMAVDANVLIFERMKEELGQGRNLHQAIEEGFRRAWDSIRDSNFSSLLTCAILFYFGSSIIRGFALNLALGILLSMFSAIMLTRTLLNFAAETKLADKLSLWGKPRVARAKMLPIIKNSKIWAGISGLLAVIALGAILLFPVNWGLDFTGGSMLEIKTGADVTAETLTNQILEVEETLVADFGTPQVVSTDQGSFFIRMKHMNDEQHTAVISKLAEGQESFEEIRFTTVGPTIGETLKQKAVWALVLASIMIVLYVAFAFRKVTREISAWKFGISAIVALIHDVIIVIGVYVVLGHYINVEVDALFITALLTVMGFSVHDTIVVFDRIRENLRFREDGETLADTANKALNQTMARSINTSLCTLITILALFIFGAESIRWFVFALIVGITAGTYSSIFIASPLLVWWTNWEARKK